MRACAGRGRRGARGAGSRPVAGRWSSQPWHGRRRSGTVPRVERHAFSLRSRSDRELGQALRGSSTTSTPSTRAPRGPYDRSRPAARPPPDRPRTPPRPLRRSGSAPSLPPLPTCRGGGRCPGRTRPAPARLHAPSSPRSRLDAEVVEHDRVRRPRSTTGAAASAPPFRSGPQFTNASGPSESPRRSEPWLPPPTWSAPPQSTNSYPRAADTSTSPAPGALERGPQPPQRVRVGAALRARRPRARARAPRDRPRRPSASPYGSRDGGARARSAARRARSRRSASPSSARRSRRRPRARAAGRAPSRQPRRARLLGRRARRPSPSARPGRRRARRRPARDRSAAARASRRAHSSSRMRSLDGDLGVVGHQDHRVVVEERARRRRRPRRARSRCRSARAIDVTVASGPRRCE